MTMLELAKNIRSKLPNGLKRSIRQSLLDPINLVTSNRRLRKAVRAYRLNPEPNRELIEKFRRAWGNESFSADTTYVTEAISRVMKCSAPVLECGSGLTTLVAALVGERSNITVWSLEQDREWVDFVKRRLTKNGIQNIELRYAPLRDYGGYVWYDIENIDLPDYFDLVLCDGPAVFEKWGDSYSQWRYGLLPALSAKGVGVGEILLDDATETRASNLLHRWQDEFGMNCSLLQSADGDYAVLNREIQPIST